MLPRILAHAQRRLHPLRDERLDEALAEVAANCYCAYRRLVLKGQEALAYATVLAEYAVRHYHDQRRTDTRRNRRDLFTRRGRAQGRALFSLGTPHEQRCFWGEHLAENCRTPVPEQVAFRLDFPAWLASLAPRERQIAEALSTGERPRIVAQRFQLTPGRVSPLRRAQHDSWEAFVSDRQPASEGSLCSSSR